MKTEITELLGIEYPVIQGGMAWVADYHLAAAVSNAGGLGLIAAGGAPAEWVREQIRETKKLTDKPFGVNIMLMNPESEKVAKVIVEEGVKVVTTGAGSPEKYMADWKAAGRRCSEHSGDCSRRHCRRQRNGCGFYAWRKRNPDGNCFCCIQRICDS